MAPPILDDLIATPAVVKVGDSAILTWATSGGPIDEVTITPSSGTTVAADSVELLPERTTTYEITVANPAGSDSATITVPVISSGVTAFVTNFGDDFRPSQLLIDGNNRVLILGWEQGNFLFKAKAYSQTLLISTHDPATGEFTAIDTQVDGLGTEMAADGKNLLVVGIKDDTYSHSTIARYGADWSKSMTTGVADGPLYQEIQGIEVSASGEVLILIATNLQGYPSLLALGDKSLANFSRDTVANLSARALAVDPFGHAFVAGVSYDGIGGSRIERRTPGDAADKVLSFAGAETSLTALDVDAVGNVIVAGTLGTSTTDGFVHKYSNNLATARWRTPLPFVPTHFCQDDAENVILAGHGSDSVYADTTTSDIYVAAYDSSGKALWPGIQWDSGGDDFLQGFDCSSDGGVYLTGTSSSSGAFLWKIQ